MKILYVIDSLSGGGAEKLINDMLPIISKSHDCSVMVLTENGDKYSGNLKQKGIDVYVMPEKNHIRRIKYLYDFIKAKSFDIVHAHLFPVTYYCAVVKRMLKKSGPVVVMTEHNTDNKRRHKKYLHALEKWIYASYDSVISISDRTQEALIEWIKPRNKNKYLVVNNGVPLDKFFNANPYSKKEILPDIKDGDILIGMVGSFTEQKGHEFMLDVMKELPSNYRLVLVGEGPLLDKVKEKAKTLKISSRITYLGFRKDVANIFKTVDVVVIPSKWEGFGLVAVEAMACGKKIVASNVPGLAEVVGEAGTKVEYGDVNGFANAILKAKGNDETTLEQARKFDINTMVSKHLKIYTFLLYKAERCYE